MTKYFSTNSERTIGWLANVCLQAAAQGRRVRIQTDSDNNLRIKVGEGAWSPPLASDPDPYRDTERGVQPDTTEGPVCNECKGTDGQHFLNCSVWSFNH